MGRPHLSIRVWIAAMLAVASLISLSAPSVFAGVNTFDPRVDLNSLDWFDRGLYKNSLPFQQCVDLTEFNAYADSNPHDDLRRDDIEPYRYRLGYADQQRLAGENPSDSIRADDYSNVEDLRCSTADEFNQWSREHPGYESDDYYTLFGWNDQRDYEQRDTHYPVNDFAYVYPSPSLYPAYSPDRAYGTIRADEFGGYSSIFPFG